MAQPSINVNDNFAERLRFWRVSQNFTQAEAARQLDIDRSYFSQVERGRSPGNALRTRFFLIERASSVKTSGHNGVSHGLRNLPVLSWAQAGTATDPNRISQEWEEVVPSDLADEKAFAVKLRGDSMEPKFSDGDIAILLPSMTPTNGEVVLANLRNEGVLCKIMHVQLDYNVIKLSSYNPAYPPLERHREQFHWIYPVASVIKPLRPR
ncbi:MAG: XRE family transcriptional regulator [Methylacidiphilales bacterium]|nr:XRE family transcriptional regulator [Candidatus Methylacidiphilales bacterium]